MADFCSVGGAEASFSTMRYLVVGFMKGTGPEKVGVLPHASDEVVCRLLHSERSVERTTKLSYTQSLALDRTRIIMPAMTKCGGSKEQGRNTAWLRI